MSAETTTAALPPGLAALRDLNRYIAQRAVAPGADTGPTGAAVNPVALPDLAPMRSQARFQATWARVAAEQRVVAALQRRPANAGPLNPHMLVLRALDEMQASSPDYLHRFLGYADALLWLEQALPRPAVPDSKPARRGRARKG